MKDKRISLKMRQVTCNNEKDKCKKERQKDTCIKKDKMDACNKERQKDTCNNERQKDICNKKDKRIHITKLKKVMLPLNSNCLKEKIYELGKYDEIGF